MFRQIKGEGLNVGCVLTWGPCFQFQRQYFAPRPHDLSDPQPVLKYDLEISGFGSQALGHVCLLNRDKYLSNVVLILLQIILPGIEQFGDSVPQFAGALFALFHEVVQAIGVKITEFKGKVLKIS